MKRITFASLALVVAMALAGCTSQAASLVKTATSTVSASEGSLPMVSQLVVGTFKLEDTDQVVTAEQVEGIAPPVEGLSQHVGQQLILDGRDAGVW